MIKLNTTVTMDAIFFNPDRNKLDLIKTQKPKFLHPDEVLVKVCYSGICGTDLHISEGKHPCRSSGLILGHEFSGIVESVGSQVHHVKIGDKVAVDPNSGCGYCVHCTEGQYQHCLHELVNNNIGTYRDGGWSQYVSVLASQTFKLPEELSLQQGALCEPLSCIAHGWDLISPITIGTRILIQGAGIIGNLWAAMLHLHGHKRVTVIEPNLKRRQLFQRLDTGYNCVDSSELSEDFEVDMIIDCSGASVAINNAFKYMGPGGKLCIFGVASPDTTASFSPFMMFKYEWKILGVKVNPFSFPKSYGIACSMGDKYLNYDKLGVKIYKLTQYKEALAELKAGSVAKAVFEL